jgi:hypothetical protein
MIIRNSQYQTNSQRANFAQQSQFNNPNSQIEFQPQARFNAPFSQNLSEFSGPSTSSSCSQIYE